MPEWGNPSWRDQGRTGPHGPKYAKRRDRNAVRAGKTPGQGSGCAIVIPILLATPALAGYSLWEFFS